MPLRTISAMKADVYVTSATKSAKYSGDNVSPLTKLKPRSSGMVMVQDTPKPHDTSAGRPVNFYDGQGFVVRRDSGVKDLKGLNGATVCVAQGTTHEVTLGDYGRANGIEWKPLVFDR